MKLNRNNADINKILNKKVAIICNSEEKELDFRRWAKQYIDCVYEEYTYYCGFYTYYGGTTGICLESDGTKWDSIDYFKKNNYDIYEWEIAEKEKIYTIRDIVENKGKLYKDEYDNLYFYDDNLYCRTLKENKFRPSILNLKQMLDLEVTEYKEEPIKITFEEALKKMETKVCRCLFSNRRITIDGSQFVDASNGEYTKLALLEIKGEWVVIEE